GPTGRLAFHLCLHRFRDRALGSFGGRRPFDNPFTPFTVPLPLAGASPLAVVAAAPALHDCRWPFFERIDPDGEITDYVLVDAHSPLKLGNRGRWRVDIQQDVMALAVLPHPICQIPQPPIFALLDFAAVVGDELGQGIGEGIDLGAGNVLARDEYI